MTSGTQACPITKDHRGGSEMKISLLGPVGSGKGTQAQRISEGLNYARIATGDLVRDQINADTELGREIQGYVERGEPVPDDEKLIERILGGRRHSLATGNVYHIEHNPPPDPQKGEDPGPFVQREDDTEEALRRQLDAWYEEADAIKEHYEEQ